MEIITQCFVENSCNLITSLLRAKFSVEQILMFLPEAASGIFESTQKTGVFQTVAGMMSDSSRGYPANIDVNAIAIKSGMNTASVQAGLAVIAPVLLQAIAQNSSRRMQVEIFQN